MNKPLSDTELIELLPSSIANDEDARAMALALQPEIDDVDALIPLLEIYKRIDELPEQILFLLAWENKMHGPEWVLAQTIEDKRNLVKNSFELNKRRGTRWAVERIFEILRLKADIVEWYEEGGAPATFRIAILDVSGRGILESEFVLLDELIYSYKPLTRHNIGINLLTTATGKFYVHGAISFVTELTVQPARIGDIDETYPIRSASGVSLIGLLEVN